MARALLLDLTRSLRRAGRIATGVDRVERAYLQEFLARDVPVFGICRTAFGYVLLDRSGLEGVEARLSETEDWARPDVLSRLPRGRNQALIQAEATIRQLAHARCLPQRLKKMLRAALPEGFAYYNVGHSNLTERMLRTVCDATGQIHVLIHDVIPLDYPQFQRPDTLRPFREKVQRVGRLADRVIYNSRYTQERTEHWMQSWGPVPDGIVAHLGTMPVLADASALPQTLPPNGPYFVTVGTIEPRKNHAFLLDLWEVMGATAPPLLICGSRGWMNEDVFARLDALGPDAPVQEVPGLSDTALAALVKQSAGLLFPSHAEGFGLPPMEALALGTRVLCNDLPVLKEILYGKPTFASVSNPELWLNTLKTWGNTPHERAEQTGGGGPTWTQHFKTVLSLTC